VRGRFERQSPVVALVERGGTARVRVVASVTQKNLGVALQECVDQSAVVNTDEHPNLFSNFATQFSCAPCVKRPDLLPGLFLLYHLQLRQKYE